MDIISFLLGFGSGLLVFGIFAFLKIMEYKKTSESNIEAKDRAEKAFLLTRNGLIISEYEKEKLKEENRSMLYEKLKAWGIPHEI